MEHAQWLELLQPFISVNGLVLSKGMAPLFTPALQELARERVTEVSPALQYYRSLILPENQLSARGSDREAIGQLIAARQLSNRPVTVRGQSIESFIECIRDPTIDKCSFSI